MTKEDVPLTALLEARDRLYQELHTGLTAAERNFLVSLALNQPKWELLEMDHVQHLPALRWKVHNLAQLQKFDPERLQKHAEELRLKLNV